LDDGGRSRKLAGLEAWIADRFRQHAGNADVVRQELAAENRPGLLSASSASMPLFTTRSTFSATSSRDRRCGSSEPKRQRNGRAPSQQREF
jgi:hypothetical protein